MRKKSVTAVLILVILLAFTGSAFSGWGPKKFGPIVISAHPWGDYQRSTPSPPCYRPGAGAGFQDFTTRMVTNFTVQFYLKYVVKWKKDRQSSVRYNNKSE